MNTRIVTIQIANHDKTHLSIDTLQKVIDKKPLSIADEVRLLDTLSILRAIQKSIEVAA